MDCREIDLLIIGLNLLAAELDLVYSHDSAWGALRASRGGLLDWPKQLIMCCGVCGVSNLSGGFGRFEHEIRLQATGPTIRLRNNTLLLC